MKHPRTKSKCSVFAAATLVCTIFPAFSAEEGTLPVIVIESQEVDLGDRSIIYNRIVPPPLAPQRAEESATPTAPEPTPVASDIDITFYNITATVFDGRNSEIRWRDGDHEHIAWLNFNILHFDAFPEIETPALTYGFLLMATEVTLADIMQANAEVDDPSNAQSLPPSALPLLETAGPVAMPVTPPAYSTTRFLQALTNFYGAHGTKLHADYARRVADREALRAATEASPAPPADTVVNFFPILEEPSR